MPKFNNTGQTYLIPIVFYIGGKTRKYKYNIKDTTHYRSMFKRFISKNDQAIYINYYNKQSGLYSDRVYIKNWNKQLNQWV